MKNLFLYILFALLLPFTSNGQSNLEKKDSLIVLAYPNSLDELLKGFKGQVVYIDILASWCKPCLEEFEHSKKLDAYFKENNIIKLFITIDQSQDIDKCVEILTRESITGYFAHSSPKEGKFNQFSKDINDIFLKDENGNLLISIPRYGIVNKNGELVVKNANRPSNSEELKKQLQTYF